MRAAFIVNKFPELSETFILNQVTGLLDLGHEVRIFAKPEVVKGKLHPDVEKYNLLKRVHYRPEIPRSKAACRLKALKMVACNFIKNPSRTFKVLKVFLCGPEKFSYKPFFFVLLVLRKDFDIIHCHFGPNGNLGIYIKKILPETKVVTTFHGYDVNSYPNTAGKDVYRELFEHGDLFTANTAFTKQQVVDLGCDDGKIEILPVGVKLERFPFSERILSADEPVRILTVGRLVEKKGYEHAIRAIAKLLDKHKNIIYSIAGEGPLRERLMSLVNELGIEGKVEFLGALSQDKVVELYRTSHIFVLSSVTAEDGDKEGQGLVLQEAQATGLPVVSTLHNGIPDGVLDGKSGFLVPEKNVDALAQRLEYLVEHPEVWPEMGRTGRKLIEQNYDIKILNEKLLGIYKGLLE
jgi:colanic acid/amylovoran biosynthesis glycosyltransferase